VASVALDAGDEVGAASATQAVVVVGDGGFEVTATVTVDQLVDLEVGQTATVEVDGVDGGLRGEVVAIGGVAGTDGSTRTFPVTVALLDDAELLAGMVATVDVVVAGSSDALTVPTSAVTTSGGTSTVTVLDDDGTTSPVEVEVGAVGRDRTAVADGLDEGDIVVLADLGAPLPSSSDDGGTEGGGGTDEVRTGPMSGGPSVAFQPPG
jgi:HlyD family secretion protein